MNSDSSQSVTTRLAKGAGWIFGFKLLEKILGFVSTLILARLLVPSDFGILAMATSVNAVVELLTAVEFETALIQRPSPTKQDYDTAWTLNLMFGVASAVLMVALAAPLASFYREPALVPIVLALALSPLIQGFYNTWLVQYRKNLQFQQDFIFLASKKIGGILIAVPLALWTRSYWALVVGIIGSQVIGTVASYLLHPSRPRPSLKGARSLLNFSSWMLIGNGLVTARYRASHFVLGRIAGSASLGVFAMASDIATLTTTELVMPLNRVIFPAYANVAADAHSMRRGYLAVIGMVALAVCPTAIGLTAVAPLAVPLLLGPRWNDVVALVPPLALFGLFLSLQTNSTIVYWALGRPRLAALTNAVMLVLLLVTIVPLTFRFGSRGSALACLISSATTLPFTFWLMKRLLGLNWRDFYEALWRPAVSSAVMYFAVTYFLRFNWSGNMNNGSWLALVSAVFTGAVTYGACISLLWRLAGRPLGAEQFVRDRAQLAMRSRKLPRQSDT